MLVGKCLNDVFGWVGAGKSREGFCKVWLFDGDEEVLALNQDRLSGSSSGDGNHWLSRDTISVAKMDYWGGTPGLCWQVPRVWLHRSSQLLSSHEPVSPYTPWDFLILTFKRDAIKQITFNSSIFELELWFSI